MAKRNTGLSSRHKSHSHKTKKRLEKKKQHLAQLAAKRRHSR